MPQGENQVILTNYLNNETAREYSFRQIRDNIINLELAPGSTVSGKDLALELGVSRTPVMEALQELSKSHLVEIYPQRGCIISKINFDTIEETAFLRRCLEKAVVEELCDTVDEVGILKLEHIIELQEFYLNRNDSKKIFELDNEFHHALFTLCNKEQTYKLMKSIQGYFDRIRALSLDSVKDIQVVTDHKAILNALKLRDKALCGQFVIKHLTRYRLDEKDIMEKNPEYFTGSNKI